MREWNFQEMTEAIQRKKAETERTILKYRPTEKPVRRRKRDAEETAILDRLCLQKWNQAVDAGKIKYISAREWYYDYR